MTFAPLFAATPIIQVHAVAAFASLAVGGFVLATKKGTRRHRALGWVWVVAMTATALTSFGVREVIPGWFSPIHLLSILTLVSLPLAIWRRRRGDIEGHAKAMRGTFYGLLAAGLFTMLPGRIIGRMLFGP